MRFLLATLLLVLTVPGKATTVAGVEFPSSVAVGDREFVLSGAGLYRKYFFKVYANALYLPDPVSPDEVLEGNPRCLLFHYFREIRPDQFAEAARNFLEKNLSADELAAIRPQLDRMNDLYQTVEDGDRYRLCYRPQEGTTLALNDDHVGTIPGERFADAYFRIWLGEESVSNDLRDSLLGRQ